MPQSGDPARCAQGLPRVEWLRWERIPGRAQGAEERAPGRVPTLRPRGTLDIRSPPSGPRAGAEMSPHAHPTGSGKGAAGTGKAGGKPGLELGRSQARERAEAEEVFQARDLGAAADTGSPGGKAGRTEVRTSPRSPLPQVQGGASSAHVSGKERKCQIAPHPLVSDGQPRTVALKSKLNLQPAYPPPLLRFGLVGESLRKNRDSVQMGWR